MMCGDSSSPPSRYTPDKTIRQERIDAIQRASAHTENELTQADYRKWRANNNHDPPAVQTLKSEFGSWEKACQTANVSPGSEFYSKRDCIEAIKIAAAEIDGDLTVTTYRAWRQSTDMCAPSISPIESRFGSLNDACEQVGILTSPPGQEYTDKDCKAAIKKAAEAIGEPLTRHRYEQWRELVNTTVPCAGTIHTRMDSWAQACREMNIRCGRKSPSYSDTECLNIIQRAANENDGVLTVEAYNTWRNKTSEQTPTVKTILNRFDSWECACKKAKIQTPTRGYDKKCCIDALQAAADAVDQPLTISLYKQWRKATEKNVPSVEPIRRKFEGWNKACREANIK